MKTVKLLLITCLAHSIGSAQAQKFEGLAPTPPMGWNSWNTFQGNINEQLVRDVADAFVDLGLREAGYQYIVIDDGWMLPERNADGNLVPDPAKFPNGMKAVADHVHARGLKFGIYNCAGSMTCLGLPGGRGHEYQDARLYASWGVDLLKYDWCHTEGLNAQGAFTTMRDAIRAAGRPMVLSICEWGENKPWTWGADVGHLWRVTIDIINCWECEMSHGSWTSLGVWNIIELHDDIKRYSGPDHWNVFDMLEVGNGLTDAEDRSHFAKWCILASPLFMGNDLRTMRKETLAILANKEVIAVDQDPLGIQGLRFSNEGGIEVWFKPLMSDEWAFVFVNRNDHPVDLRFDWHKHAVWDDISKRRLELDKQTYVVRDLFAQRDLRTTNDLLEHELGVHDALMVRLVKR